LRPSRRQVGAALTCGTLVVALAARGAAASPARAVRDPVRRVLPAHAASIRVRMVPPDQGRDVFVLGAAFPDRAVGDAVAVAAEVFAKHTAPVPCGGFGPALAIRATTRAAPLPPRGSAPEWGR
jgi:hypothetical protein